MSEKSLSPMHRAVTEPEMSSPLSNAAPLPAIASDVMVSSTELETRAHPLFRLILRLTDILLTLAVVAALCCAAWEYSTHRYVDAFSDAIVPVSASPERKIQSILDWMTHPPKRFGGEITPSQHDRDPLDTLNYKALLQICGTATNAFINLADTSGLGARRLLLLGPDGGTMHVDAEVWIDGRWFVVDPTFHVILRGVDGKMLTRRELADPAVFSAATRTIPRYDRSYSFERTTHIRLVGIPLIGKPASRIMDSLFPAWQDSAEISLIVERQSLLDTVVAIVIALILFAFRLVLYWVGSTRLGVHSPPLSHRIRSAYRAFMNPAS